MADSLFKVGVLGATGFIGSPYRAEIRECEEAEIVAVCARREELLDKAAQEGGGSHPQNDPNGQEHRAKMWDVLQKPVHPINL